MTSMLKGVNDAIFRELERLEGVDPSDADAMASEVSRAKAVESLAGKAIENGKLILSVAQASVPYGERITPPRGLIDG